MQINYLGRFAIATFMLLAAGCTSDVASSKAGNETDNAQTAAVTASVVDPCASSNSDVESDIEADPCAGIDPCAGVDPCAGATPAEDNISPDVSQTDTVSYFVGNNGLAIHGTDPVAYFTEGAAVAGRSEFTHTWGNATWQFASAENRDQFAANPAQYAPQYGGFCAWAVSQGYTASIDPNAWRIVEGRLYLNYSKGVQQQWEQDIPGNISKGDANWPGVLTES